MAKFDPCRRGAARQSIDVQLCEEHLRLRAGGVCADLELFYGMTLACAGNVVSHLSTSALVVATILGPLKRTRLL